MSDLHELCGFQTRPIGPKYIEDLKFYLKNGIPATYTIEEAYNYTNNIEEEPTTTTTPLHIICSHIPNDASNDEIDIINQMVEILLEYGAGWCLTDINDDTPGCILIRRKLNNTPIYNQVVAAGVRAELLLRKVSEYDMEIIEDTDDLNHEQFEGIQGEETTEEERKEEEPSNTSDIIDEQKVEQPKEDLKEDPSSNQETYLKTKLEYKDGALVTKDRKDGVMMSWETDLMRMGCDSLFKGASIDGEIDDEVNILNIGFGMGIIDTMINNKNPTKQYICEAHPDVLAKLRLDGWYEKQNVVILEGRWQEQLNKLLSEGNVFFNGIYYDTYSEHYEDMLELFDIVVGILKPHGVFSFFNGLGADRQVVYEVYKQLVEMDLANYGLICKFEQIEVPESTLQLEVQNSTDNKSVWDDIKRAYWTCPTYYHPEARFMDV
ncbi:DEHA2E19228p [Debaryomyces hansenii CBS767]|jgi:protein arginine N-methyltransferase 2|uniref:Protein arginine N-methyltransferase 2 n=1 Tax=Debaryomyces hansenii (strain ATCC 36239 / CBS 767 / BCRC 21394 / JCM 1990 / NBRC 0083 / IGC 2968) TaxID=284592 RepID=RMT2_DEBHA|nr:DEHA2E19228p [Debaryomyces hansenii CBS767]Q6BNS9.1 RecName: Full=Protein arginine N-methyltransferase 2; AltName: Full=Protein-arginine N5-methyltransferase; AltName: Full=Type IV protein arginine N-methyltransferase; Short=Type IV PRMT [Debaryomyces hansenii CBS767]CAG88414.1 DEHA2E19228p [Debaryomyces hansenii CBS767]|eukprot:XP_460141.1 DEHA2E19228p [Debaryomyces hansenii CBS767]